ncbi:MAG: hypothetical protein WCH39_25935, partial [Schlesneria sp.]
MSVAPRFCWLCCWFGYLWPGLVFAQFTVSPLTIALDRPESSQQLLVTNQVGSQRFDLTRKARYLVAEPAIITIETGGRVIPLSEGITELTVTDGDYQLSVPVTVTGLKQPVPVSFRYEVQPVLTKARCNAGGCHGKAEGQNGFKLSLFGFDNESDFDALVKET